MDAAFVDPADIKLLQSSDSDNETGTAVLQLYGKQFGSLKPRPQSPRPAEPGIPGTSSGIARGKTATVTKRLAGSRWEARVGASWGRLSRDAGVKAPPRHPPVTGPLETSLRTRTRRPARPSGGSASRPGRLVRGGSSAQSSEQAESTRGRGKPVTARQPRLDRFHQIIPPPAAAAAK